MSSATNKQEGGSVGVMADFLEANIEEAASHKQWHDIETKDHRHLSADEAREEFKAELRAPITPEKYAARCSHGFDVILQHLGEYPNDRLCLKELEKAAKIIASTPDLADKQQGDVKESIAVQLGISPETLKVFYEIGLHLYADKQFEDAICVFTFLSILCGYSHEVWLSLGLSHYKANEWIPAIQALTTASVMNPDNPIPYLCSVECYLGLDNKENAETALKMAKHFITDENRDSMASVVTHYESLLLQHP